MVSRVVSMLNREFTGINQAALLLGGFTLLSQILGLVRDRLLASMIGPGETLDIYYMAFKVPNFIFVTIASLVSVTILIPFFQEMRTKDTSDAKPSQQFMSEIATVFSLGMILVGVLAYILMPQLASLVAPGFSPEAIDRLLPVARIMLLSPILLGLSNVVGTVTQGFRKFTVYALTPVVYNIGIVVGVVGLYPIMGLTGLAWGVILGALLHLGIQLPVLARSDYHVLPTFHIHWPRVWRVFLVAIPRSVALSLSNIVIIVLTALATTISPGAVSIFNFSINLQNVPLALIGLSYSVAAFPTIAKNFADGDIDGFIKHIVNPARQIIFWSLPVIVLFIVLRAHIVRVILGAGAFDWSDTRLTAATLALFVISVVAQSLVLLLVRAFYAAGDTKKPLVINLVSSVLTIGAAFGLVAWFDASVGVQAFFENVLRIEHIPGTSLVMLALAYSVGLTVNCLLLWRSFRKRFLVNYPPLFTRTLWQNILASLSMGVVTYGMLRFFDNILDINTFWGVLGQGFFSGVIGICVGLWLLLAMKNEEILAIARAIKARTRRAPLVVDEQDITAP